MYPAYFFVCLFVYIKMCAFIIIQPHVWFMFNVTEEENRVVGCPHMELMCITIFLVLIILLTLSALVQV